MLGMKYYSFSQKKLNLDKKTAIAAPAPVVAAAPACSRTYRCTWCCCCHPHLSLSPLRILAQVSSKQNKIKSIPEEAVRNL
jgi:hypothetical protein